MSGEGDQGQTTVTRTCQSQREWKELRERQHLLGLLCSAVLAVGVQLKAGLSISEESKKKKKSLIIMVGGMHKAS